MSSSAVAAPLQPTSTEPKPEQALMQIASGYFVSSSLHATLYHGIPERLAAGPKSVEQLAKETGTNADALHRVMRFLGLSGIYAEVKPRTFALTPISKLLLRNVEGNLREAAEWISDPNHHRLYAELHNCIRDSRTSTQHAHGCDIWTFMGAPEQARMNKLFNEAMTGFSSVQIPALLKAYDFGRFKKIVDVGGGYGHAVAAMLKKHPQPCGIVFDQPRLKDAAQKYAANAGLSNRLEFEGGNFFERVTTGGDCYFLKFIIHDWYDAEATKILSNIRKAIAPHGKLILAEGVLRPENPQSIMLDVEMLVLAGGKERTADEYSTLLAQSGFELKNIHYTDAAMDLIEAVPV